jgi:hypothetical protein
MRHDDKDNDLASVPDSLFILIIVLCTAAFLAYVLGVF